MKFYKYSFALFASLLAITSCNSDNEVNSTEYQNVNANTTTLNPHYGRLELPKLAEGSQYNVLVHTTADYGVNLIIEWDCNKKAQRWTAYQMYTENSKSNWNRNDWNYTEWHGDPFQPDQELPAGVRSELRDYQGTGYQRGHICPSADRLCSQEANEQTFYLSNIQPQIGAFNSGVWLTMETELRKWNVDSFRDTLYVCKGGTIADSQLLEPTKLVSNSNMKLPVPKYFFMAVLCKKGNTYKAMAFWAEHKADASTKLLPYVISIDKLEELTGIDFFCNLPDNVENAVESIVSPSSWGIQQ